uniref:Uncharacterized protein n=1 Tax=Physcomitrium patens TaxID=3218 RepID=A0A2K1JR86_PHYPA|nr:hypothetical protein PHYPA_016339 [Physcomitrium patens]
MKGFFCSKGEEGRKTQWEKESGENVADSPESHLPRIGTHGDFFRTCFNRDEVLRHQVNITENVGPPPSEIS